MGRIILEDGSQYLPVKFRISEFYQQHPKGKIRTSLMWFDRQNNNPGFVESVLIKAEVYRDDATLLAEAIPNGDVNHRSLLFRVCGNSRDRKGVVRCRLQHLQ